jgi:hypothetical protein
MNLPINRTRRASTLPLDRHGRDYPHQLHAVRAASAAPPEESSDAQRGAFGRLDCDKRSNQPASSPFTPSVQPDHRLKSEQMDKWRARQQRFTEDEVRRIFREEIERHFGKNDQLREQQAEMNRSKLPISLA